MVLNVSYVEFKKKIMYKILTMAEIIDFCKVEQYSFVDYLLYFVIGFSVISIGYAIIKGNMGSNKKNRNKYQFSKNYFLKET